MQEVEEVAVQAEQRERSDEGEALMASDQAKLLRVGKMVRELQEEVAHASVDEAGRALLPDVYERALDSIEEALSAELRSELGELTLPVEQDTPTESEIRLAQAQLVGWLEGLLQGIQAAMLGEQLRQQQRYLEQRTRQQADEEQRRPRGQYL